jgi:Na+/glutamate symporter
MQAALNGLHDSAAVFFAAAGRGTLKFTPKAAVEICLSAATFGYVVARIEGGLWHEPGFEARVDCIWDGADPPIDLLEAQTNNAAAAQFVRDESKIHNAFVLTAPPLGGWPHPQSGEK